MGQARHPTGRPPRSTHRFHHIFGAVCPKQGQGCSPRHDRLQYRSNEPASPRDRQGDRPGGLTPYSWSTKPAGTCRRVSLCPKTSPSSRSRQNTRNSTRWRMSGSSCGTIGSPTASSNPTATSSIIAVPHGTSSSTSHGWIMSIELREWAHQF
jgi:hypothetical protein